MRVKFEYPVRTALRLKEAWPVEVNGVRLEWRLANDCPVALIASCATTEKDRLPSLRTEDQSSGAVQVDMGHVDRHDDVERVVRSTQGLLSIYTTISIKFDECEISWEPESDEERKLIKLNRFRRETEKADIWMARRLSYDLVARAMAVTDELAQQEVTLAFVRQGNHDFHDERYIQAYYNFFFFLETQFAAGYSDPKRVVEALLKAQPLQDAISQVRSGKTPSRLSREVTDLLRLSDESLIRHFVKTRGDLHHHALRRPRSWHPDKPEAVATEADLLRVIVNKIATRQSMALMFRDGMNDRLMADARAAGATTTLRVIGFGLKDGVQVPLQPIEFVVPGHIIDRGKIYIVNRQLRGFLKLSSDGIDLVEYTIRSADERQIFLRWRREDAAKVPSSDQQDSRSG